MYFVKIAEEKDLNTQCVRNANLNRIGISLAISPGYLNKYRGLDCPDIETFQPAHGFKQLSFFLDHL